MDFHKQAAAKYNILAFGDSLTEGFHGGGMLFHPYSTLLQQKLQENGLDVKVYQRGLSGERVVTGMTSRLPEVFRHAEAAGIKFNWVIIMGGINDLGWSTSPDAVFAGLQQLYRECAAHGARVLALTCLETMFSHGDVHDHRGRLNALIRGLPGATLLGAANHSGRGGEFKHVTIFDTEKAVPYPRDGQDADLRELWDDGLHLTPAGYDRLALALHGVLKDRVAE